MTRQPIASSMLASIGYDEFMHTLEVEFLKGGEVWQYAPVSSKVFACLTDPTASAGRVFHAEILRNPSVIGSKLDPIEVGTLPDGFPS